MAAWAARPAAAFPQLFPIPHVRGRRRRQAETELMGQHTDLSAMVGLVRKHVAQHFHANRPGLAPAVTAKFLDAAVVTERFREHLGAASGALGQRRTGLSRRAGSAIERSRNSQVRSGEPDPLAAHVTHVGEDCRNGADIVFARVLAGQLGCRFPSPGGRVKMLDQHLVYAVTSGEYLDRRPAKLGVNTGWMIEVLTTARLTRGHGSLPAPQPIVLAGPGRW